MDIKDLISHFSTWEKVPIDVQDHVIPVLSANTQFDLFFWPMPDDAMDIGIFRGFITQWEKIPFGETYRTHVSISYAASQTTAWQRLICCKELVHILDPIETKVRTDLAFNKLIEKIVLPPEMQDAADGVAAIGDRWAIWQALAILFPWATRELLLQPYVAKTISIERIAELVDLPLEYVQVVMNDVWAENYHSINTRL